MGLKPKRDRTRKSRPDEMTARIGSITVVIVVLLAWLAGVAAAGADPYSEALEKYRSGSYREAASILSAMEKKDAGVYNLLGWAYLMAGDTDKAKDSFERSLKADPSMGNSLCGLGHVSIKAGAFDKALEYFGRAATDADCASGKALVQKKLAGAKAAKGAGTADEIKAADEAAADDEGARARRRFATDMDRAGAFIKKGDNLAAGRLYAALVDAGFEGAALDRLLALYGLQEYRKGQEIAPPVRARPKELSVPARTSGDYLEVFDSGAWKTIYVKGVNIGPARPGEYPSTPPEDVKTYLEWLGQIARMNSNTVRVYTILPPAFYTAFKIHNERSREKLRLLQEVWLTEKEDEANLYESAWTGDFRREVKDSVDVVHGNANIPYRPGHASGVYTADVSPYLLGIGVGREVEPSIVMITNAKNPGETSYKGRYISVRKGSPSEVWFAMMSDLAVAYEVERYNTQAPITLINWPPLDPMHHVSEANYLEEIEVRRRRGETGERPEKKVYNDADAVSLDMNSFVAGKEMQAGLFASFHVYPHWPDFLFNEKEYAKARDAGGPNRYLGYLLDLKAHYANMPLLVAEYGVATSWGSSHIHPDGWGNGGLTEKQQAEMLIRFTKNIRDSKCAGGLVFAWIDEWWKRVSDEFTRPYSDLESKPLWLNMYDPEELFGIIGYRAQGPAPLLRGFDADWEGAKVFAVDGKGATNGPGEIKGVRVKSDPVFLYVRLDVEKGGAGSEYAILLNTLPGAAGSRKMPDTGIVVESGANFILNLSGKTGKIRIAESYYPNAWYNSRFMPGGRYLERKPRMEARLEESSGFVEIVLETNQVRYGRDGEVYAPKFFNRSDLVYGSADPESLEFTSHAAWHMDAVKGVVELRIPWGLIYFTNPAGRLVFSGTEGKAIRSRKTSGVSIAALELTGAPGGKKTVKSSFPALNGGRMDAASIPVYSWEEWTSVKYEPYAKESYKALKAVFKEMDVLK